MPIESTAIGLAYLAGMTISARDVLLKQISQKYGRKWPQVESAIKRSRKQMLQLGYCTAESNWHPGLVGIGANIIAPDGLLYGVNISVQAEDSDKPILVDRLAPMLLQLVADIKAAWNCHIEP